MLTYDTIGMTRKKLLSQKDLETSIVFKRKITYCVISYTMTEWKYFLIMLCRLLLIHSKCDVWKLNMDKSFVHYLNRYCLFFYYSNFLKSWLTQNRLISSWKFTLFFKFKSVINETELAMFRLVLAFALMWAVLSDCNIYSRKEILLLTLMQMYVYACVTLNWWGDYIWNFIQYCECSTICYRKKDLQERKNEMIRAIHMCIQFS